jgi:hypothetical protein
MIPLMITIISAIIIFIAVNMKEDFWGFMCFISIIAGSSATIISWLTWGLMMIFKS